MNGDRPSQANGILFETSQNLFFNAFVFIQRVLFLFPGFFFEGINFIFPIDDHTDFLVINPDYFCQFSVEIPLFATRIVTDKHNLRTGFQL